MSRIYRAGSNSCHVLEFQALDEASCFGVNVLKVGQIMERFVLQMTPTVGPLFKGIFFWRGKTIPVLDLRRMFQGHETKEDDPHLLILQILNHEVGFLVNRAKEVHYIDWNDVSPAVEPRSETGGGKYISGVAALADRRKLPLFDFELLVMEQLFGGGDQGHDRVESAISLRGIRLLYAEDSSTVRQRVFRKLIGHGADVIAVADGKEALDILTKDTERRIKLVITDVEMPRMDGFRLLREIQSTFPGKYQTMVYTSLSHGNLSQQANEVGANRVLTKYDDSQLVQSIAELLHVEAA